MLTSTCSTFDGWLVVVFYLLLHWKILYSYVDVTSIDEGLQNFGLVLAHMAFDQKEIIIVPRLLYHRNRGGEG